jgi:hypothetical protein
LWEKGGRDGLVQQKETGLPMMNAGFHQIASSSLAKMLSIAAVVAVAFAAAPAGAQGTPEQQQACQSDAFRLCSEFIPDVPRTTACMKRNRARLSPVCRAEFSRPVIRHRARTHRT